MFVGGLVDFCVDERVDDRVRIRRERSSIVRDRVKTSFRLREVGLDPSPPCVRAIGLDVSPPCVRAVDVDVSPAVGLEVSPSYVRAVGIDLTPPCCRWARALFLFLFVTWEVIIDLAMMSRDTVCECARL